LYAEIASINIGKIFPDNCSTCLATTEILHIAALTQPVQTVVNLLIRVCNLTQPAGTDCNGTYSGVGNNGPYLVQMYASMTSSTGDFAAWCHYSSSVCSQPPVIQINESQWFSPKPANLTAPPPSGQVINVMHLSDSHLDTRYDIGSEANCSAGQCCRPISRNTALHTDWTNASVPASRFGEFICDTPPDLLVSAFVNMPKLIDMSKVSFAIFTGDVVSHDPADQLSQAYDSYEEEVTYQTFKAGLGGIVPPPIRRRDADGSLFTRRWEIMILRHKHGLHQILF
jgi:sphingomyelin phosphodiesterase